VERENSRERKLQKREREEIAVERGNCGREKKLQ
jgi:hypothetical protein